MRLVLASVTPGRRQKIDLSAAKRQTTVVITPLLSDEGRNIQGESRRSSFFSSKLGTVRKKVAGLRPAGAASNARVCQDRRGRRRTSARGSGNRFAGGRPPPVSCSTEWR